MDDKPNIAVSEKTIVQLKISSWVHVVVILATILGIYFSIRSDIATAIRIGSENADTIKSFQSAIFDLQISNIEIKSDLKNFHNTYEHDSNKYIRNSKDRTDRQ